MAAPIDPPAPNTSVRFPFKLDELTTIASYFLTGAWPAPVFKTTDERQWRKRTPWTTQGILSAHESASAEPHSPYALAPALVLPREIRRKKPGAAPRSGGFGQRRPVLDRGGVVTDIRRPNPGDAATRRQRVMKTETSAVNVAKA